MQTTLALDPGTRCGFAVGIDGAVCISGVWNLKPASDTRPGQRGLRLYEYLHSIWQDFAPTVCVYEDVKRHPGPGGTTNVYAAQCYGGLKLVIEVWCEMHGIRYEGINVSTIKKIATGKGNAKKHIMLAAAQMRWPDIQIVDHNHADSLWILETGYELERIKNRQPELFSARKGKR